MNVLTLNDVGTQISPTSWRLLRACTVSSLERRTSLCVRALEGAPSLRKFGLERVRLVHGPGHGELLSRDDSSVTRRPPRPQTHSHTHARAIPLTMRSIPPTKARARARGRGMYVRGV